MDDERGPWAPSEGDLSPSATDDTGLTRRELRAREHARLAALAAEADEARDDQVHPDDARDEHAHDDDDARDDDDPRYDEARYDEARYDDTVDEDEPSDQQAGDDEDHGTHLPRGPLLPTPPDVVWGPDLTMELPPLLPAEPDVDDVRWDAPVPPIGHVPRAPRWPAGPVGADTSDPRPFGAALGSGTAADGGDDDQHDDARDHALGNRDRNDRDPFDQEADLTSAGRAAATDADPAHHVAEDPDELDATTAPRGIQVPPPVPRTSGTTGPDQLPTLDDLLATRREPPAGPAELGWQGTIRRLTGGLIAPGPGAAEQRHRRAVATVQRSLDGPKTIVVINPKGGAHKTTASLLIAATFGTHRGGYTLAWDNNETRGTLGWRSQQARHHNTAVNLLQDLERFGDPGSARVGDLDNYVRAQSARFDVLASDEDAASAASIDAFAFRALHRTLSRFYRVMVVDTGNNMRASNWQAAVEAADQVVIVSTVREDTAQSAAWAVDALRATGHEETVRRAVTVLAAPAEQRDDALSDRLHTHFGRLTRTVLDVPYDPALVAGGPLDYDALAAPTREAWLQVTAAIADGL